MRKIGLDDKEKLTIKLIMGGMTPYAVSRHLKMSNNAIYCRVNRARKNIFKCLESHIHNILTDCKTNISKPLEK